MVNTRMFEFKHPKYYTELRKRNKSDQVISRGDSTEAGRRAPGPGLKQQASSSKQQATSLKPQAQKATSPKQQASSLKPQASSSMILEPRKSFTVLGPRASTMMKVLCGCLT